MVSVYSLSVSVLVFALSALPVNASSLPSEQYDCTVVQLEAVDESTLTKAERIAKMEQSLQDSIDQHDSCTEQSISSNAAGGSGAQGAGGEGQGGARVSGEQNSEQGQQENSSEHNSNSSQHAQSIHHRNLDNNGAKNQQIEAKDNDAAICQMLSEELQIEQDLQKQKELKEIYKNYRCR